MVDFDRHHFQVSPRIGMLISGTGIGNLDCELLKVMLMTCLRRCLQIVLYSICEDMYFE